MAEFLAVGGVIAVAIVIVVAAVYFERRGIRVRREQMQAAAASLGLEFIPDGTSALRPWSGFRLFNTGRAQKSQNVIRAPAGDIEMLFVDQQYTTGHGKSTRVCNQTAACIVSEQLDLPEFFMRPETLFDRIAGAFGRQDIDFVESPVFSRKYLLQGPREFAIRALFHEDALRHFETISGITLEGRGRLLLFYRATKRVEPQKIPQLLEEAYRVFALLRQAEPA